MKKSDLIKMINEAIDQRIKQYLNEDTNIENTDIKYYKYLKNYCDNATFKTIKELTLEYPKFDQFEDEPSFREFIIRFPKVPIDNNIYVFKVNIVLKGESISRLRDIVLIEETHNVSYANIPKNVIQSVKDMFYRLEDDIIKMIGN